jgi:hypothetical protein
LAVDHADPAATPNWATDSPIRGSQRVNTGMKCDDTASLGWQLYVLINGGIEWVTFTNPVLRQRSKRRSEVWLSSPQLAGIRVVAASVDFADAAHTVIRALTVDEHVRGAESLQAWTMGALAAGGVGVAVHVDDVERLARRDR